MQCALPCPIFSGMALCHSRGFISLQVGVSVGFIRLLAKEGLQEIAVEATNVLISCVAVLLMCAAICTTAICCQFKLPARFGAFTIGAYCIYVTTCVVVLLF